MARARRGRALAALPWPLTAAVLGATSIAVGMLWDISWHATIGRDTFWTPAHLAIYLGGLLSGLSAGWVALATTFHGTAEERAVSVRFWGFRAPLGAWVAIWGTFAMLTSAPFDDWWHNAYGLDVTIISPPHLLLAAGIFATQIGAMLQALALQNRTAGSAAGRLPALVYLYATGSMLAIVSVLFLEYSEPNFQHGALFYEISCGAYPLILVAAARASRRRWAATTVAGIAMAIRLAMTWILPLFPAVPRLAPIYNPIHHMWPPFFPPLLIVPAVAIDLLLGHARRTADRRRLVAAPGDMPPGLGTTSASPASPAPLDPNRSPGSLNPGSSRISPDPGHLPGWSDPSRSLGSPDLGDALGSPEGQARPGSRAGLALALGAAFFAAFLAAHWYFAEFLLSPYARNWFFAADQWTYRSHVGPWSHQFWPFLEPLGLRSLAIAVGLAAVSARLGMGWGDWMSRVRR